MIIQLLSFLLPHLFLIPLFIRALIPLILLTHHIQLSHNFPYGDYPLFISINFLSTKHYRIGPSPLDSKDYTTSTHHHSHHHSPFFIHHSPSSSSQRFSSLYLDRRDEASLSVLMMPSAIMSSKAIAQACKLFRCCRRNQCSTPWD